jgi:hypothetical protein
LTYIVDENCIRCKIMDCVEVCPVDCFFANSFFSLPAAADVRRGGSRIRAYAGHVDQAPDARFFLIPIARILRRLPVFPLFGQGQTQLQL